MKTFELFRYNLPTTLPSIPYREGLILCCKTKESTTWSEIAPLEGLSEESVNEIIVQFRLWQAGKKVELYPSLTHALYVHTLPEIDPEPLPISALLMGTIPEMEKMVTLMRKQGISTAKIKVSHLPVKEGQAFLKDLLPQFRLRLDVNRKWSFVQALDFFAPFAFDAFEYIEEPTYEIKHLSLFPWPFALDETLLHTPIEKLEAYRLLKTLIIRPPLHGKFDSTHPLYQFAKSKGLSIIFSSTFETSIGVYQLAKLAQTLKLEGCMGLDTFRYFQTELLQKPLVVKNGMLKIPKVIEPNLTLLQPV